MKKYSCRLSDSQTDYRWFGLPDFGKATIREVVAISTQLEQETGTEFIHMQTSVPG